MPYFGILYENAPTSGVYENFSLVLFPDIQSSKQSNNSAPHASTDMGQGSEKSSEQSEKTQQHGQGNQNRQLLLCYYYVMESARVESLTMPNG